MTDLEAWLREHRARRARGRDRRRDPRMDVTSWREQELLPGGDVVEALVAVLETVGCSHQRDGAGCTMCGYVEDTPRRPPSEEEMLAQIEHVASVRGDARWVKLYTSGSMLDPGEVPPSVVGAIADAFDDVDMLTVESRAEHVTPDRVASLGDPRRTEVAIGLESTRDAVLEGSVNKGMTFEGFERAAGHVREAGARLRAYVLLKPPFLTEAEAIDDAVSSAVEAGRAGADVVSLNPVSVHGGTLVDYLHHRREYEPPWLWSVVEVLQRAGQGSPEGTRILSSPTAGGKPRGAHNCGRCDKEVLRAIEFHRLSGDADELARVPPCRCRERWTAQLEVEAFMQGPFAPFGYRRR